MAQIEALAARQRCTPARLVLAWVLAQGRDIVPIPGTPRRAHLEENLAALSIELTAAELAVLHQTLPPGAAAGLRYPEMGLRTVQTG